ncbi:tRNA uridine-5-carboxymethylaminomethyl(34) synthesis enzyme MnmG [Candidatus Poribacteria bacterium]|nr:tRNA uridine-5-carboxymethylaminomethyl(34) synthesis enzyme MnmG [Candidatus Poribacteria bacterium]MCH2574296.1 tRNA uridine-5-carboxymethylaminomethyl(34) synthesis enzyme MnmG [Candidatus Poribacteria bacterium]
MNYYYKNYDVLVVGAGHAGCEAALASARMGCQTLMLTISLDTIGKMSCNPAIGGLAKGHLVKEIDALGGEMAKAIDETGIQFRQLNTKKGPAVRSSRAQADKKAYQLYMKQVLENQDYLDVKEGLVEELLTENGQCLGVISHTQTAYLAQTVILTTGTFLKGTIHIGDVSYSAGRAGESAAEKLSESFLDLGFEVGRLKTGTPPRVNAQTVDFSKMEIQPGDEVPKPFSFSNHSIGQSQLPCYITYTNSQTHDIIRNNLERSAMYSGRIQGVGPRYCPSIEDKVVRFEEKNEHRIFVEPEGRDTQEIYLNGISASLPEDVQVEMVRSIQGLEKAEIMRFAYAVEYDFAPATQLYPTLETKRVRNLFFAGQLNGTTGYEEAAAQGLMAGINASLKAKNQSQLVLDRASAYIGVLIDDLVTKDIREPYRMFTSRAEHRLQLREDNADWRLTEIGYQIGTVCESDYNKFVKKKKAVLTELRLLSQTQIKPTEEMAKKLEKVGLPTIKTAMTLADLLKRPHITYQQISDLATEIGVSSTINLDQDVSCAIREQVEIQIKYAGYIARQDLQIEKFRRLETLPIPSNFNFDAVHGLKTEARKKLSQVRPVSIGHASRVPGVTPADISILMVWLKSREMKEINNEKKEDKNLLA